MATRPVEVQGSQRTWTGRVAARIGPSAGLSPMPRRRLVEHGNQLSNGKRPAEIEALPTIAVDIAHAEQLLGTLDALRRDADAQLLRQQGDRLDDRQRAGVAVHPVDEGLVD